MKGETGKNHGQILEKKSSYLGIIILLPQNMPRCNKHRLRKLKLASFKNSSEKDFEISTLASIGRSSSFTVQHECLPINQDGYHQLNVTYKGFVIDSIVPKYQQ